MRERKWACEAASRGMSAAVGGGYPGSEKKPAHKFKLSRGVVVEGGSTSFNGEVECVRYLLFLRLLILLFARSEKNPKLT